LYLNHLDIWFDCRSSVGKLISSLALCTKYSVLCKISEEWEIQGNVFEYTFGADVGEGEFNSSLQCMSYSARLLFTVDNENNGCKKLYFTHSLLELSRGRSFVWQSCLDKYVLFPFEANMEGLGEV